MSTIPLVQERRTRLDAILNEIDRALNAGFYYLAITAAMTLPGICAALKSPAGRSGGPEYKAWFDENLASKFGYLTAEDCYSFRCGVIHQGRFGDFQHNVQRVVFALPGRGTFVNCKFGDAYVYSVVEFCRAMMAAVRNWYDANEADQHVQANIERLVRLHSNGLAPYIVGMRVLG